MRPPPPLVNRGGGTKRVGGNDYGGELLFDEEKPGVESERGISNP